MLSFLKKHEHWWQFLFAMTAKEIKARYKHAVLGFLWIFLNPLLQMLVIGLVFQFFVPVKVDNYFLFLFSGLLPWIFFSYSLTKCTPAIIFERGLIKKAKFPREAIILSIVLSNFFHFLVALGLFLLILILFGHLSLLRLLLLPVALVWIGLLTSGLSLLTAALNVKYRDINFLVQAVVPLWFYATPIVYTLDLLPDLLQKILYLNPVTAIIEMFRFSLIGLSSTSIDLFFISILVSLVVFLLGCWFFRKENKNFDDWV